MNFAARLRLLALAMHGDLVHYAPCCSLVESHLDVNQDMNYESSWVNLIRT